ncbi:MAG: hypothetical protein C0601_05120 [Candidatus Muiribacterium halophilum]|uniref:Uncharacterized protein n=1 Tax=Muiribacterium halophilum TaxID=2053465 RepID=A0A2N5ZIF1_MUIH1|nr:MAG: hypothetical protein C0601_05120 [Candidatus Muirbacterium halophilum]
MKKTMILLISLLLFSTINIYALKAGKDFNSFTVSEHTKDGMIMIDINYFASFGKPVVLHIGINGWDNIQDIYSNNGEFELEFDRDVSRIDICFKINDNWDNNKGQDYFYNTTNYICKEFIKDNNDLLIAKDYVEESIQTLKDLSLMIEYHYEKNKENLRLKNTTRMAIFDGLELIKMINDSKSKENIVEINKRLNLFRDVVENLI